MAPFPEEVDVFSGPHSRMKQLVEVYSEKLSCTDFTDYDALESLLHSLHQTFCEFKSHEQIENKYIMKKLKTKLKALSIQDAAVCNCHSDNRLSDMLALVHDGYSCTKKSASERINYGLKLQHALKEFTETFLPHMKEEEEVFQPMLIKYFEYEELKCLKETVIEQHVKWQDAHWVKEKSSQEVPEDDSKAIEENDSSECSLSFAELSYEVVFHIFSYLKPRDLLNCSQVCHSWNRAAFDPHLWRELYPIHWARGYWESPTVDPLDLLQDRLSKVKGCLPAVQFDEDADFDESSDSESSCLEVNCPEEGYYDHEDDMRCVFRERNILNGIIKFLLPKVGPGVQKIVLAASKGLTSRMLRSFLVSCPNMLYLDVSYTTITDSAFKGLTDSGCLLDVQHLDFSGCSNLSDLALYRIADCMITSHKTPVPENNESAHRFSRFNRHWLVSSSDDETEISSLSSPSFCGDVRPNLAVRASNRLDSFSIEDGASEICNTNPSLNIARQLLCKNCPLLLGLCSGENSASARSQFVCGPACGQDGSGTPDHLQGRKFFAGFGKMPSLQHFNISGCSDVTDDGIRYFADLDLLQSLTYLDVSGCWNMTGPGLCDVVKAAPKLSPCNLFYCDYIVDGPYPNESNGCQNLQCAVRLCCCSGE